MVRRSQATILLSLLLLIASGTARADDESAPAPPPSEAAPATKPAPEPGSAPRQLADPALELYQRAFLELLRGDRARARAILEALTREYPEHAAAPLARQAIQAIDAQGTSERERPQADHARPDERPLAEILRDEKPTGLARAELMVLQTLHGIGVGVEVCAIADCDDFQPFVALMMLGGGAGLTGSLLLTRDGITHGTAAVINAGTEWGLWNAIALSVAIDPRSQETAALLLGGQLAGLAAGVGLSYLEPSAGDVSLAMSAGIWTGALTSFIALAADRHIQDEVLFALAASVGDVGLIAGALIANEYPMSRGRALLLDLGGIVGGLFGFGVAVLAQGDRFNNELFFSSGALFAAAGLGSAIYFSRDWDHPDEEPDPDTVASISGGLMKTDGGAIALIGGRF